MFTIDLVLTPDVCAEAQSLRNINSRLFLNKDAPARYFSDGEPGYTTGFP